MIFTVIGIKLYGEILIYGISPLLW